MEMCACMDVCAIHVCQVAKLYMYCNTAGRFSMILINDSAAEAYVSTLPAALNQYTCNVKTQHDGKLFPPTHCQINQIVP